MEIEGSRESHPQSPAAAASSAWESREMALHLSYLSATPSSPSILTTSSLCSRLQRKIIILQPRSFNEVKISPFSFGERRLMTACASAETVGTDEDSVNPLPLLATEATTISIESLPLESKERLKLEQKLRMKLAKKIRLRRKRLVRKRRLRKKGRWPPSKMKKLKNV